MRRCHSTPDRLGELADLAAPPEPRNRDGRGDREFLVVEAPDLIGDISMFTGEPTIADSVVKAACVQPGELRALVAEYSAEYRKLGGDGFERFEGEGVYYAAGHAEAVQCRGRT